MVVTISRRSRGFTLIEMLVVLSVIGLLLSLVAPRYLAHVDHARDLALKQDLKTLRDAIDKFSADRAHDPADLAELVAAGYLREVPSDPVTDSTATWLPVLVDGKMHDLRSGAAGNGEDGTPYASW